MMRNMWGAKLIDIFKSCAMHFQHHWNRPEKGASDFERATSFLAWNLHGSLIYLIWKSANCLPPFHTLSHRSDRARDSANWREAKKRLTRWISLSPFYLLSRLSGRWGWTKWREADWHSTEICITSVRNNSHSPVLGIDGRSPSKIGRKWGVFSLFASLN